MNSLKVTTGGLNIVMRSEGCKLIAYKGQDDIWTIGWGSTYYKDGSHVKEGDHITQEQANDLLLFVLNKFGEIIRPWFTNPLVTNNMFSACLDLAYNEGPGAFHATHLLQKVNANPFDTSIRDEFMKFRFSHDKYHNVIEPQGLVIRCKARADLYFTI